MSKFPGVEWWESTAQDHAPQNSPPREESQDAAGPWWFATLTEAHVVAERNRTTVATRYLAASHHVSTSAFNLLRLQLLLKVHQRT